MRIDTYQAVGVIRTYETPEGRNVYDDTGNGATTEPSQRRHLPVVRSSRKKAGYGMLRYLIILPRKPFPKDE